MDAKLLGVFESSVFQIDIELHEERFCQRVLALDCVHSGEEELERSFDLAVLRA